MKQKLDVVLDRPDQGKPLNLEAFQRYVPSPHLAMPKLAGPRILAVPEGELPAYLRAGNWRFQQRATESKPPSERLATGAVRDDSDMIGEVDAVGVAHSRVHRLDPPTDPRQRLQRLLQRIDRRRPGTRQGDCGGVGCRHRKRDFGAGGGQPIERKAGAGEDAMI